MRFETGDRPPELRISGGPIRQFDTAAEALAAAKQVGDQLRQPHWTASSSRPGEVRLLDGETGHLVAEVSLGTCTKAW